MSEIELGKTITENFKCAWINIIYPKQEAAWTIQKSLNALEL
jgi:hypothetical protein